MTAQGDDFVVADNFLSDDLWHLIWEGIGHEQLDMVPVIGQFTKTWGFDGGLAWSSPATYLSEHAGKTNYASVLGERFRDMALAHPQLVKEGWDDVRLHTHVFGRGTRLYWHYDKHSLGSFVWYAHPEWQHHWGGEMMVADQVPRWEELAEAPPLRPDRTWEEGLLWAGIGTWITPRPNRCVLTAPGLFHGINRVDPDAGGALRCSVVGFLVKWDKQIG